MFVILLLALVFGRIALAGMRSEDPFVRLVCWAVAAWFAVQSVENIGMNLGLLPVTGLPLPFLSYGGSSMFACWAALGVVVAVTREPARRGGRRALGD